MADITVLNEAIDNLIPQLTPIGVAIFTYWLKGKIDKKNYENKLKQDSEAAIELREIKRKMDEADFPRLLDNLSSTTSLVQSIQGEISNKFWVKQEIFHTKQEIMLSITKAILELAELVRNRSQEHSMYHHIFYEHCGFSGGGYDVPYDAPKEYHLEAERLEQEYWSYVEQEIENEKESYRSKYGTKEYRDKDEQLFNLVVSSIEKVLVSIRLNQAILHVETVGLCTFLELSKDNLTKDNDPRDEGLSEHDWSEYQNEKFQELLVEVEEQLTNVVRLTKVELGITDKV
ncbi:TPA: hypothetical protein P0E06_004271 [Vibrio fluvialis clinical-1]|nr:hypothetical protein [Vibrio fluvialis]HDM8036838.1 hypothetical protein [Vibrio fluvialis clinical-1]